jgi:hypothetical protein
MVSHLDPPFGPEYMNNISRFLSSYLSAHIVDERNAVAATQPINSMPGGFINIRLVRQPQVLSNLTRKTYFGNLAQLQHYPTRTTSPMFVARFVQSSCSPATNLSSVVHFLARYKV